MHSHEEAIKQITLQLQEHRREKLTAAKALENILAILDRTALEASR